MRRMRPLESGLHTNRPFHLPEVPASVSGYGPLPDCPLGGLEFDYWERQGFQGDIIVYLLTILGLVELSLGLAVLSGMHRLAPPPAGFPVRLQAFEEKPSSRPANGV